MERKRHFRQLWRTKGPKDIRPSTANQEPGRKTYGTPKSAETSMPLSKENPGKRSDVARSQTSQSHVQQPQSQAEIRGTKSHGSKYHAHPTHGSTVQTGRVQDRPLGANRERARLGSSKIDLNPNNEFNHMTLGGDDRLMTDPSRKRYSEDVADRNIGISKLVGRPATAGRSVDILDHNLPGYPRVVTEKSKYSEDVADRNLSPPTIPSQTNRFYDFGWTVRAGTLSTCTPNSKMSGTSIDYIHSHSTKDLHHAQSITTKDRMAADKNDAPNHNVLDGHSNLKFTARDGNQPMERSLIQDFSSISLGTRRPTNQDSDLESLRSSLSSLQLSPPKDDGPTPILSTSRPGDVAQMAFPIPICDARRTTPLPSSHASNRKSNEGLEGSSEIAGLDHGGSVDSELRTKYAPVVTYDTVTPTVRHIKEEQNIREIHNHDVLHRILPIRDVEFLPARHYIPESNGDLKEVPSQPVPRVTAPRKHSQTINTAIKNEKTLLNLQGSNASIPPRDYGQREELGGARRWGATWNQPSTLAGDSRQTVQKSLPLTWSTNGGLKC